MLWYAFLLDNVDYIDSKCGAKRKDYSIKDIIKSVSFASFYVAAVKNSNSEQNVHAARWWQ